jgi:hypothetical protein
MKAHTCGWLLGHLARNDTEALGEAVAVVHFKFVSRYSSGGTEDDHRNLKGIFFQLKEQKG